MEVVPEDLADLVHRAARTTAPHAADLAVVRRRARARRRRRAATTAGGLAVLVALTGGTVPLLTGTDRAASPVSAPSPPPTDARPATPAPPRVPAQRLMLDGGGGTARLPGGPEIGLISGSADEMTGDGTVVRHQVPAGWEDTVALPDGRLVGLKLTDLKPGVKRTDGPNVAGLSIRLMVLGAGGRVERSREVRVKGQALKLVGADTRHAYLARDGVGLVAHELATGREEILVRAATKVDGELPFGNADVAAGLVASATGPAHRYRCQVDVRRLDGEASLSRFRLDGDCTRSIRLSPDGSLVAVPYARPSGPGMLEYRVTIVDTATGQRRADQLIGTTGTVHGITDGGTWGAAWVDATSVRVAWVRLPESPSRVYSVAELARPVTVTAQ